ncbi:hypothetical protein GGX14DRAFT_393866 [Mycena pura]|uniref:DUF6532 domain-containing protein n=1 Tax=Mycena pura TaxID=153505 RepID=A0AAD6VKF5_9AGAR|nr:hypothetical protein GGX14DRAFT_393866 [Mycena pura]
MKAQVAVLEKKFKKQKKDLAQKAAADDNDADPGMNSRAKKSKRVACLPPRPSLSSPTSVPQIRTLGIVSAAPAKPAMPPKPKKAQAPKPRPRNSLMVPPSALPSSDPPPSLPSPLNGAAVGTPAVPGSPSIGEKRPASSRPGSPAPKHPKQKLEEPPFIANFVAGPKPKAADYAVPADAVIVRGANHYGALVLTSDAAPGSAKCEVWQQKTFKEAGKVIGQRYAYTPHVGKIIGARGPAVRGKKVDAMRPLVVTLFDFKMSKNTVEITANKEKAAKLLHKPYVFHYKARSLFWNLLLLIYAKDQEASPATGFAEHPIFDQVRSDTIFANSRSIGVVFSDLFNPLTLECIALDITVLHHCIKEWTMDNYATHLVAVKKWSKLNEKAVLKLRRKITFVAVQDDMTRDTENDGMDAAQEAALRAELAGLSEDSGNE